MRGKNKVLAILAIVVVLTCNLIPANAILANTDTGVNDTEMQLDELLSKIESNEIEIDVLFDKINNGDISKSEMEKILEHVEFVIDEGETITLTSEVTKSLSFSDSVNTESNNSIAPTPIPTGINIGTIVAQYNYNSKYRWFSKLPFWR